MAQERISMRKIKEVLRLHYEAGLSQANNAKVNRISRCAVQQYIMRFTAAGLNWPLSADVSDIILEHKLFPGKKGKSHRPALDYEYLLNPDYAIGFNFGRVTGNEKRDVLSQSPRNHSRRFMASDNFRMRRLPSFTM